ncbi:MAG: hypothetical protein H7221_09650 [Flavobacterium sp.]|nr:hypothetical protein [Flavobacterium sp.]
MKKLLSALVLVILSSSAQSQTDNGDANNEDNLIYKNDKEAIYLKNNSFTNFADYSIIKINTTTNKVLYDVKLNIPVSEETELVWANGSNKISTFLIDNEIQIIYDVVSKKEKLKQCYLKTLNINGNNLSQSKLLSELEVKDIYNTTSINYRVVYSPDKSKFALMLHNYYFLKFLKLEPIITIYDSKKVTIISTKKLNYIYEENKFIIDPYKNFILDNDANLKLLFATYNEKTLSPIKTYQCELFLKDVGLKNIKEVKDVSIFDNNKGYTSVLDYGRFYKSYDDYLKNKPFDDLKIDNGALNPGFTAFNLINKNGEKIKTKISEFPFTWLTFRNSNQSTFKICRATSSGFFIVLMTGKISLYCNYMFNENLVFSEGEDGELKGFSEKYLIERLKEISEDDNFKNDKPKSYKDQNELFNQKISWYKKYIDILNKKK